MSLPWLAAIVFFAHLFANPHYGFFRDELYFIVCGRHPAFGYVDQPPLVPLLAAASQMFGLSLFALRAVPAAFAAGMVYVVVALVREMGGGRFAAVLGGSAAALAPVLMAFGTILGPDTTQIWLWPLAILFSARALRGRPEWWLAAGAAFGVAAEGKYSAIMAACALVMGLAAADRRPFFSRHFWFGILIAGAILLPNALWQWDHGLPMLELLRNGQHGKNIVLSPAGFLLQQLLLTHPVLSVIWIVGLGWCFYHAAWRWLGVTVCALLAIMIVLHGKAYYPAPIYPAVFAAGGVAIERVLAGRRAVQGLVCAVCIVAGLALAPLTVPVLPEEAMVDYLHALTYAGVRMPALENHKSAALGQIFADMHGWEALAHQVRDVRDALPASVRSESRVFARNYGEAAAIDVLSGDPSMPPALSGHNQYWQWGPRDWNGAALIDVGGSLRDDEKLCTTATSLGRFHAAWVMPYEDGMDIILCLGLREPVAELWPGLKHFE